jgi:tetratricopeptide (TPR) repeat protein
MQSRGLWILGITTALAAIGWLATAGWSKRRSIGSRTASKWFRSLQRLLAASAVLGLLGYAAWVAIAAEAERREIDSALSRVRLGWFDGDSILPLLRRTAARHSDRTDVQLALGLCEVGASNEDAAIEAWQRIPRDKPDWRQASILLVRSAGRSRRWSVAHHIAVSDMLSSDERFESAVEELITMLRLQGRITEAKRAIRTAFSSSSHPADLLKQFWAIDTDPFPIEGVRAAIEVASALAPGDLDQALARAHLAVQTSAFDDARELLDACVKARPEDSATWEIELLLAQARGDASETLRALEHLPASWFDTQNWLVLGARLAGVGSERADEAWRAVLEINPANVEALARLAESKIPESVQGRTSLQSRKAAIDGAQRQYEGLLSSEQPEAFAVELAELSTALGRTFDARGWLTIAARRSPGDPKVGAALRTLDSLERARRGDAAAARRAALQIGAEAAQHVRGHELARDSLPQFAPQFEEVAKSVGLEFQFVNGATLLKQLPETMSGGVALLDFDNDGWLDVYAVQGGAFPNTSATPNADRLFRNRGDGTFEDVSARVGLDKSRGGYGHGVTVGDVNNDGYVDVFVTRYGAYALYMNQQGQRFIDSTNAWGLDGDADWPTSAAFADFDNDGDLDLYVCHYLAWDCENPRDCRTPQGAPTYCPPAALAACADRLFRNDGERFVDVSREAGISDADTEGRGLGVLAADLDGDGLVDLFVANDTTANYFFRNLGGLRFEEGAVRAGLSANASGGFLAGMGIACGDLDSDGVIDLAVTNFYGESTTLYKGVGDGLYVDRTTETRLGLATRNRLGFGLSFADVNNDGCLDILQANGHVDDYRPAYPYAMPAQLLLGTAQGRLSELPHNSDGPWKLPRVGRGLATGDLNNDGKVDCVIVDQLGPLAYLRNATADAGRYLVVQLRGTKSNRDAVGARLRVESGKRSWVGVRLGGGSYQSANDARLHFGLGDCVSVDRLTVEWPAGTTSIYRDLRTDRGYLLEEGEQEARPLAAFEKSDRE